MIIRYKGRWIHFTRICQIKCIYGRSNYNWNCCEEKEIFPHLPWTCKIVIQRCENVINYILSSCPPDICLEVISLDAWVVLNIILARGCATTILNMLNGTQMSLNNETIWLWLTILYLMPLLVKSGCNSQQIEIVGSNWNSNRLWLRTIFLHRFVHHPLSLSSASAEWYALPLVFWTNLCTINYNF